MGYNDYIEYSYSGPVLFFDKVMTANWTGNTFAPSEKRARSNLAYRFRKEHGLAPGSRITLPGKIIALKRKDR